MTLDISFLLSDPDFCAAFAVERFTEAVDDKGRAQLRGERLPWRGVVQPATARELERLPEGDRDRETITVYSREPLRVGQRPGGDTECPAADVIHWQGQRYEVASVEPWPGYVRALATLLPEAPSA